MTGCYDDLVTAGVRTRDAAALMGLSKATQDRRRSRRLEPLHVVTPAGRTERPRVVVIRAAGRAVLDHQLAVDQRVPEWLGLVLDRRLIEPGPRDWSGRCLAI